MALNFFALGVGQVRASTSLALHPETPNAGSPFPGSCDWLKFGADALFLRYPCITFEIMETHNPQTPLRPFRPPAAQSRMRFSTGSTGKERL
ncbi:hypothetical protein GE21DRAFT_1199724 [Neurospora crassa]|nr:hypothetical protein GE21DRAFT_1199724 [Neurospora crassa]